MNDKTEPKIHWQYDTKQEKGLPVIITTFYARNWDGACLFRSPILVGTNVLEALACNAGTSYRLPEGKRLYWQYSGCVLSLAIALPFLSTRVSYIEVILSSRTPAILLDTLMILWSLFLLTNDNEPYQATKQKVYVGLQSSQRYGTSVTSKPDRILQPHPFTQIS